MKNSQDPRHRKRKEKIQDLFSYSFQENATEQIEPIIAKLPQIDKLIQEAAPEWPLAKINKVDLAILRNATYELLFDKDIPEKVSIDEAVEIAKTFGAKKSPSFVNGVLGTILNSKKQKGENSKNEEK